MYLDSQNNFRQNSFRLLTAGLFVGSMEAPLKVFLLFFLFSDWLKIIKSSQKWKRTWFFEHFLAPYLLRRKGHFTLGRIFRAERHFLLFKDQLVKSGRQKTKENIIPHGKFHLVENDPNRNNTSDNYAASFGAKKCSKTKFLAAEMILDPWKHVGQSQVR